MKRVISNLPHAQSLLQVRYSAWNFQEILESRIPDYNGRPQRTAEELATIKASLPKIVFQTSSEFATLTKPRSNVVGEYTYQRDFRQRVTELMLQEAPQKLAGISTDQEKGLAELKALQNLSEYSGDLLEGHLQDIQRLNDFVDSNPVYLLDQPLREEARWNTLAEMDNTTRAQVRSELRNWLPEDFRQQKAADIQQVAAASPSVRKAMLAKIDERVAQTKLPDPKFSNLLKAEAEACKRFVDPTFDITPEAIARSTNVDELRDFAHRVAEYNADERLALIFEKSSQLTGDVAGQNLLKQLK
eukprot:NODE_3116_length_1044_cov_34.438191_g2863_i0.p1 GENE.NODE_3116_length_1044_cov_34.438191_g2863_i0~~NODE_3116_length_1044_cov_34.438191_g2863_i0.p1  ORF type:complete len:302 (+),score=61.41 NODE_3116_length_1044_cov_34.438191_g2863_i0:57-962(+)